MHARNRLGKFLLRREIYYEGPGETWSRRHRAWLGSLQLAWAGPVLGRNGSVFLSRLGPLEVEGPVSPLRTAGMRLPIEGRKEARRLARGTEKRVGAVGRADHAGSPWQRGGGSIRTPADVDGDGRGFHR